MPATRVVESGYRHEGVDLRLTPQASISIELPEGYQRPKSAPGQKRRDPGPFASDLTLLAILNVGVTGDACRPQASRDDPVRDAGVINNVRYRHPRWR